MLIYEDLLNKMSNRLIDRRVHYAFDQAFTYDLNQMLNHKINIHFTGKIHCIACGRSIKKTFNQGYCFPCVRTLARCDTCIIKPELCHYAQGTCREPEWGEKHCLKPHYIYLANTGSVKIGITRKQNIPHRWIDQGAVQVLPVIYVHERLLAGLVEVAAKNHIADKTNWRTMLKGDFSNIDLNRYRDKLIDVISERITSLKQQYGSDAVQIIDNPQTYELNYPVGRYPNKILTHNLDKQPNIQGKLLGIKGQYLILDNGVINIRKFSGYECQVNVA